MKATQTDQRSTRLEFRAFARHLIGRSVSAELATRYVRGCKALFPCESDSPALAIVRRHPALTGPLDAACALLSPEDPLHRRLLLTAAVLETTPEYADVFLPRAESLPRIILTVMSSGFRAALRLVFGIPLLLLIRILSGK